MLTQLLRSGYLDGIRAIVTGTFSGCGPVDEVHPILTERLADLGMPTISWANIGHGGRSQSFPIGVAAELDADAGPCGYSIPRWCRSAAEREPFDRADRRYPRVA
ncbi:hypothetical protein [Jatrophihabitans lederbergiae]|uniref:LD-carboxypeptidase C-terminal domain-containing protein n=1 Tax=Jatrophihabitans lederbergiae TaxID=3075547 RepID=A0ABU2JEX1_9ACTN|nr:hypothetical protein [Jatrophihabitans sp. DSM 44399]MDT0262999.1 hypothetical protein [Jatrophihabitans sp. DSM 44399]